MMKAQDRASKERLATMRAEASPAAAPSIVAGWHFLSVDISEDDDALPIRPVASVDGPSVVYHPDLCPISLIENPTAAMLWLPMALTHITHVLLAESAIADDGVGAFASPRWEAFRRQASHAMSMEWHEIVAATRRDGVELTADNMTSALFVETGIQAAIARRMTGSPSLRLV